MDLNQAQIEVLTLLQERPRRSSSATGGGFVSGSCVRKLCSLGLARRLVSAVEGEANCAITPVGQAALLAVALSKRSAPGACLMAHATTYVMTVVNQAKGWKRAIDRRMRAENTTFAEAKVGDALTQSEVSLYQAVEALTQSEQRERKRSRA